MTERVEQVLRAVDSYFRFRIVYHLLIAGEASVGGADSDMICGDVEVLQTFLNGNPCHTPSTPQTYNKTGAKPALGNLHPEAVGIVQQLNFSNVAFCVLDLHVDRGPQFSGTRQGDYIAQVPVK